MAANRLFSALAVIKSNVRARGIAKLSHEHASPPSPAKTIKLVWPRNTYGDGMLSAFPFELHADASAIKPPFVECDPQTLFWLLEILEVQTVLSVEATERAMPVYPPLDG
jgi:hypothetical protein